MAEVGLVLGNIWAGELLNRLHNCKYTHNYSVLHGYIRHICRNLCPRAPPSLHLFRGILADRRGRDP